MKLLMEEGMGSLVKKVALMSRTKLIFSLLLAVTGLLACQGKNKPDIKVTRLPYYNTPDFTPIWLEKDQNPEELVSHTIDEFSFHNQHNQEVNRNSIKGKIHIANFFFTACPSICPKMMHNIKKVNQAFEDDENVLFMSYSVMPWDDTIPKLKKYASNEDIQSSNWNLLTGRTEEINTLARRSYFVEEEFGFTRDSSDFLHTEHVILVDADLRIRGIYNGTVELDMLHMIDDIKLLKQEL